LKPPVTHLEILKPGSYLERRPPANLKGSGSYVADGLMTAGGSWYISVEEI